MKNYNGDPGLPGTKQWDDYFENMPKQLADAQSEVQREIEAIFQGVGRPSQSFTTVGGTNPSTASSTGQNQGAGDATSAPIVTSSSSRKRRTVEKISDNGPKAKTSKANDPDCHSSNQSGHAETAGESGSLPGFTCSGRCIKNGNSISWSGTRDVSVKSNPNGDLFLVSNTGTSQFQRQMDGNSLELIMDGVTIRIRPREEISLDDVRASFNDKGLLEINFANSSTSAIRQVGNYKVNNHRITWTANRLIESWSQGETRFFLSNTGSSQFQRVTNADHLSIEMDGVVINVHPGNGIPLDAVLVTLNNEGLMEIQIPDLD